MTGAAFGPILGTLCPGNGHGIKALVVSKSHCGIMFRRYESPRKLLVIMRRLQRQYQLEENLVSFFMHELDKSIVVNDYLHMVNVFQ